MPLVLHEQVHAIQFVVYLEAMLKKPVYKQQIAKFDNYYLITIPEHSDPKGEDIFIGQINTKKSLRKLMIQRIGNTQVKNQIEKMDSTTIQQHL